MKKVSFRLLFCTSFFLFWTSMSWAAKSDPSNLERTWTSILKYLKKIWEFKLATIEKDPLTIGEIVFAILLFTFGYFASKVISHILRNRILSRFKLTEGAVFALQTITFYLLIFFFIVLALNFAHIPLTAFTVLGGALAIGVGFGSQNLINNFISGLIILVERPIKAGDIIEVDSTYGRVSKIGARCTHVRTFTNVDILVPNSAFLEKNVINWTHTDNHIRTHVTVGVIYASPVDKVIELLKKAVDEHECILNKNDAVILFTDFGDNSLNFEIHFWLKIRSNIERKIAESDLRIRINQLFKDAGIVIAFPQRDVHLDSVKPLEIKMVNPQ